MTDFFKFRQGIQEKKELDPVKDKALDKKFKNRKDKDIDNDGDVDSSDEYLHKRRKAIDKAMDKESSKKKTVSEASTKELKNLDIGDDVMVNGKMGMFYGMQGSKVKVRFPSGQETVSATDVEIMDLMTDSLEEDEDGPCWKGYKQVGMKMKNGKEVPNCVPEGKTNKKQMVADDLEKDDDDPCWDGYVQVGTKMKNGKEVPKCVPMEEAKKHMKEEFSKILSEKKVSSKDEKELSKLMTKALDGKQPKSGYTSEIANNGDFVVKDGGGRVVGRIKKGEFKNPMKEEFSNILSESDDAKFQAWYKKQQELEKMQDNASKSLRKFPTGDMGLVPASVKKTSAFKKAKADYNAIAKALGKHNKSAPKKWLKMASDIRRKEKYGRKTESSKTLGEAYDYPDYGPTGAAEMAMTQLYFIQHAAGEVIECLKAGTVMPEWYQNKIAKLEGDMEGIHSYMAGKKIKREMCGPDEMEMDDYDYDMDDGEDDIDDEVMDSQMMAMGMYEAKSVEEGTGKISSFKDDREKSSAAELAKKAGLKVKDTGDGIELSGNMKKISDVLSSAQKRGAKVEESTQISEKLSPTDNISDWIKDFKDSDAPQFQGKSAEERKDMAIAAYYDARDDAGYDTPQQGKD